MFSIVLYTASVMLATPSANPTVVGSKGSGQGDLLQGAMGLNGINYCCQLDTDML